MLPEKYIEKQLQYTAPELRDIVLEVRNIITRVAPGVTEVQHRRGFSYYYKERGGPVSAGVCLVELFPDHVRLGFIHGAFLPDPQGLLVGEARYKKHMRIYHYDEAPWETMQDMIAAASRFDPYWLKERAE